MIRYHDPMAETAIEATPYELGIRLRGSNSARIALLANGFPDSENFLHRVAAAMAQKEPGLTLTVMNKGNASVPANEETLKAIQTDYQALITAYGH